MRTIKSEWFDFGLNLGVPHSKLKEFVKEENPLSEVIGYWHRGNIENKPVTWGSILDTLKETEQVALANEIEAKYCQKKSALFIILCFEI